MGKIQPKDIITTYTVVVGGWLNQDLTNRGYNKSVTIESWFRTAQEAFEWEEKIKQFIIENRDDPQN